MRPRRCAARCRTRSRAHDVVAEQALARACAIAFSSRRGQAGTRRGRRGSRARSPSRARRSSSPRRARTDPLHQDAVLERARLRLVGVADEVVRLRGLARDRLPLQPVGNAAPPRPSRRDSVTSRTTSAGRARARAAAPHSRRRRGTRRATSGRGRRRCGAGAAGRAAPAAAAAARSAGIWSSRGSSPAIVRSAAGARSQRPRHGLGCAPSGSSKPASRHERSVQTCSTSAGRSSSAISA